MKKALKDDAIKLRHSGLSYSEILNRIHVSKSTLSLWIRSIPLTDAQKKRFTLKRKRIIKVAHYKSKQERIERTKSIKTQAKLEIKSINDYELLLIGTMLYWAEGAKQKEYEVSQGVCFSNSDPFMIKIFLTWLKKCLKLSDDMIHFDIYVHENYRNPEKIGIIIKHWSLVTGFSIDKFDKMYYKKHKLSTNRKNKNNNYFGLLRVKVRRSTDLNRKITGLIEGVYENCGVV